ncbi:MAG: hypothetical protein GEU75_17650 [Dehalococcoidia bacterium]|nr:hypothetical protein [Dehalococcoidia bacterium]
MRDAIYAGRAQLNDFRLIRNGSGRRLTPEDTIEMHEVSIEFLALSDSRRWLEGRDFGDAMEGR